MKNNLIRFNEIKKEVKLANTGLNNYGVTFIAKIVFKMKKTSKKESKTELAIRVAKERNISTISDLVKLTKELNINSGIVFNKLKKELNIQSNNDIFDKDCSDSINLFWSLYKDFKNGEYGERYNWHQDDFVALSRDEAKQEVISHADFIVKNYRDALGKYADFIEKVANWN